jgi:hypothetical protein
VTERQQRIIAALDRFDAAVDRVFRVLLFVALLALCFVSALSRLR